VPAGLWGVQHLPGAEVDPDVVDAAGVGEPDRVPGLQLVPGDRGAGGDLGGGVPREGDPSAGGLVEGGADQPGAVEADGVRPDPVPRLGPIRLPPPQEYGTPS